MRGKGWNGPGWLEGHRLSSRTDQSIGAVTAPVCTPPLRRAKTLPRSSFNKEEPYAMQ